ncbi:DMT family transporter [Hasllibacter sp. MH4015]|uniref:DMT family transporter n=1 Tax=Hasllibacter sp. MH4015 TaxID=2854029 RepID=UPI001CD64B3A|nr:DMT family transporter [Hasllibacter sp. MH4015]
MGLSLGFAVALVVAVGAALAMQAPINAVLAREMGDPTAAAAISFAVGFLVLAALAWYKGTAASSIAALSNVPWWALMGGVLGAIWVWAAIWSVPRLGVVTMFGAMILGQLLAAIILDARGAFGMEARPIDLSRIMAIAMVAGGVVLSRA